MAQGQIQEPEAVTQEYTIEFQLLKEKYQIPVRVRTYCIDVAKRTHTRVEVLQVPRGGGKAKFKITGERAAVTHAIEYIQGEFIVRQRLPDISQNQTPDGLPLPRLNIQGISGPRKSAKPLNEADQQSLSLADADQPYLLTEAALRMHDRLTGTCELREFACEPCDNVWWRVVSVTKKMVSRCSRCHKRYDALLRNQEYGVGRFKCQGCGNVFLGRCRAMSSSPCYTCQAVVSKPYIHPKFNRRIQNPRQGNRHYCDSCHGHGRCPNFRKVVVASNEHDSTGSTLSTFLSQLDFGGDDAPYFEWS